MRADDIQLAIEVTGSKNPYIIAGWLSEMRGYWAAGDMAEVKQALGIDPNQIDAAVAAGIGSLIEPSPMRNPRMPQTRKRKIDEELTTAH